MQMIRKPWCHNPGSSNDVVHGNVAAVLDVLHLIKNLWNLIHLGTTVASVTQIFQMHSEVFALQWEMVNSNFLYNAKVGYRRLTHQTF